MRILDCAPKIGRILLKSMFVFGVIHPCMVLSRATLKQQKQQAETVLDLILIDSARSGYIGSFRELLQRPNLNVNSVDKKEGKSALHWAARRNGGWEFIQELLRHPQINVNVQNRHNIAPLHLAAVSGYIKNVQELLKHPQINVNIQNARGESPLHLAVTKCFREVVGALLKHPQINVNVISQIQNQTPLDYFSPRFACGGDAIKQDLLKAGAISRKIKKDKTKVKRLD